MQATPGVCILRLSCLLIWRDWGIVRKEQKRSFFLRRIRQVCQRSQFRDRTPIASCLFLWVNTKSSQSGGLPAEISRARCFYHRDIDLSPKVGSHGHFVLCTSTQVMTLALCQPDSDATQPRLSLRGCGNRPLKTAGIPCSFDPKWTCLELILIAIARNFAISGLKRLMRTR